MMARMCPFGCGDGALFLDEQLYDHLNTHSMNDLVVAASDYAPRVRIRRDDFEQRQYNAGRDD